MWQDKKKEITLALSVVFAAGAGIYMFTADRPTSRETVPKEPSGPKRVRAGAGDTARNNTRPRRDFATSKHVSKGSKARPVSPKTTILKDRRRHKQDTVTKRKQKKPAA